MNRYTFNATVWRYRGTARWHFVTLPKMLSRKIRAKHGLSEEGWGRLKAKATIGKTRWPTAIWFDTKAQSYLLPLKAVIRKKEKIASGSKLKVQIHIEAEGQRRVF